METKVMPGIELTAEEMCTVFSNCTPEELLSYEKKLRYGFSFPSKENSIRYWPTGKEFESERRKKVIQVGAFYRWFKTRDGELNAQVSILNTVESKKFNDPIYIILDIQ